MSVALNSYGQRSPCSDTCKRAHAADCANVLEASGRHIVAGYRRAPATSVLHGVSPN